MSATEWDDRVVAMQARIAALGRNLASVLNPAIDLALDCTDAGRGDLSVALLEPLTQVHYDVAKLWQVLALAYRAEQDLAPAFKAMARAAALAPNDARIAMGQAQIAQEAGQPSAHLFASLSAAFADNVDLAISYAGALLGEGQSAAAKAHLEQMVAIQPRHVAGQDALAQIRNVLGDADPMRGYMAAVVQHPHELGLRIGWINALARAQAWNAAREVVTQARAYFGDAQHLSAIWDAFDAMIASETGDIAHADMLFARLDLGKDPSVALQFVRHALRTGQLAAGEARAMQLVQTGGAIAASAWPYLGLFWRLRGDDRAAWLDGDPPFVRVMELDFTPDVLAELTDVLRGLHTAQAPMPGQSVRGGTQTDQPLLHNIHPAIQALRSKILAAVRDYVDALPPPDATHPLLSAPRQKLQFAGSWSVRLQGQGFHVAHTHTHGWISSALYIAVPDAVTDARMKDGWLELGAPPPELGLNLPAYRSVQPKPGRLVLFPSTMWHGTQPFANGERLTVAFDVARPVV